LAGLQEQKAALEALGAKIIAASVDDADKITEAAPNVTFPIATGVTEEQANAIGAWWGKHPRGMIIQPSEFIIKQDGTVVHSMYASGPVGRMNPPDIVLNLEFMAKQAK
jgi:peroxiredoxin